MIAAEPGFVIPLERVARLAGGTLVAAGDAPRGIRGASIDTRTLEPGQLFVPLAGGTTDGHRFLGQAFARGAAAALCARSHHATIAGREPGPLVVVDDVTRGLQDLARGHRAAWPGTLFAVTGSMGKTTAKNLLALALATRGPTHRTEGNLNNHWGVPLTLLGLEPVHHAAVVELGMNHAGEIATLAAIAAPDHGIVTGVGSAHIEFLGSVEAIAREKASLAWALAPGGVLFAAADSEPLLAALAGAPCRIVTFGFSAAADVRPERVTDLGPEGSRFEVRGFPPVHLRLVGRHQIVNALAALAVARERGLDPAAVVAALETQTPEPGRMEVRTLRGATLLVDCYNANPESTRAALETLRTWPRTTRRIAVLGDMLELGDRAPRLHRETAAAVRDAELWVVGAHASDYAAGAAVPARTFADKPALAAALAGTLAPGTTILFKASRGAALEDVVEALGHGPKGAGD